ncbi:hypothetical protein [Photobacterium alginatilyticum]|uniref:Uncharacterized protein n=1 Tax=Photobacterium alginatilyticum TaxID=1775171 RepID=A0ABW9YVU0_9GAMM|nr:hypothetical protein [Photobacterium alginatilyticum]NBI56419.1 hypothetical protein [Photobacterium alginatilyticum]
MNFRAIYEKYLNTLENISNDHEETTDTDVRERLHEVINWYFIWGKSVDSEFPLLYSMFSPEGDALIAQATKNFIEQASEISSKIPVGAKRNAMIEDSSVLTKSGESYDLYLGSAETVLPAEKPANDDLYGDYD